MGSTPSFQLFIDDTGTRAVDRPSTPRREDGLDHFAMGGLLIQAEEAKLMEARLIELRKRHNITAPFHSSPMRSRKKAWAWLGSEPERADRLMRDLTAFLCSVPGYATAWVMPRPGYEARYFGRYSKEQRWALCKSAYTILVERAAKLAAREGRQLAVYVEQCGPKEDGAVRAYHTALRDEGMLFDPGTSGRYSPLGAADFKAILLEEPKFFTKELPLGQVADLLLYPLVKGRYDPSYRPYRDLVAAARLLDFALAEEDRATLGTKYYCFDGL